MARFNAVLLPLCLVLISGWQFGEGVWIHAKAIVAQQLIERAWDSTLREPAQPHVPWHWADTWPVLRMQSRAKDEASDEWQDTYVLAGVSGTALAFGPGLMEGTALPGDGTTVLAAHRDTHFAMLEHINIGDPLRLQTAQGRWFDYEVMTTEVVDTRERPLVIAPDTDELVLLTCYPFSAWTAGGPLRLVVVAAPVYDTADAASLSFDF
ncbi:MAG: class GN sortase [Pseudomonadota bacterium]